MIIVKTRQELREARSEAIGIELGFVPTMGALHRGHASLIERSKKENQMTWTSIFVNPTQFNQREDLELYPRPIDQDLKLCDELGVDLVFLPTNEEMYPYGEHFRIVEHDLSTKWCGAYRPGHFSGMLTVVMKLLSLTQPTRAYFGEKDYQQILLVQSMVKEFFLDTQIVPCATIREIDGLAMSSRNLRLKPADREKAPNLYRIISSELSDTQCFEALEALGFKTEYVESYNGRRLAAAWLGGVRLIDNVELQVRSRRPNFSKDSTDDVPVTKESDSKNDHPTS
jgi:pantoate--beta-alanine ligase